MIKPVNPNKNTWRLIIDGFEDGPLNMATDEALLKTYNDSAVILSPILRIYGWKTPILSIGYGQKVSCDNGGLPLVRRLTGGRTLLHGLDLSYSVISQNNSFPPLGDTLMETYEAISQCLSSAFRLMAIDVDDSSSSTQISDEKKNSDVKSNNSCLNSIFPYEITIKGKKIVGSAQRRLKNAFIQHGSIMIGFDSALNEKCFGSDISEKVTFLTKECGKSLENSRALMIQSLEKTFCDTFKVTFLKDSYTDIEEKIRYNLLMEKYRHSWYNLEGSSINKNFDTKDKENGSSTGAY